MARSRSEAPVTSPAHRVRELRDSAKTRQQIQTGKILASTHRRPQDIKVLDHFIVAGTTALSFAERGLL